MSLIFAFCLQLLTLFRHMGSVDESIESVRIIYTRSFGYVFDKYESTEVFISDYEKEKSTMGFRFGKELRNAVNALKNNDLSVKYKLSVIKSCLFDINNDEFSEIIIDDPSVLSLMKNKLERLDTLVDYPRDWEEAKIVAIVNNLDSAADTLTVQLTPEEPVRYKGKYYKSHELYDFIMGCICDRDQDWRRLVKYIYTKERGYNPNFLFPDEIFAD